MKQNAHHWRLSFCGKPQGPAAADFREHFVLVLLVPLLLLVPLATLRLFENQRLD